MHTVILKESHAYYVNTVIAGCDQRFAVHRSFVRCGCMTSIIKRKLNKHRWYM